MLYSCYPVSEGTGGFAAKAVVWPDAMIMVVYMYIYNLEINASREIEEKSVHITTQHKNTPLIIVSLTIFKTPCTYYL